MTFEEFFAKKKIDLSQLQGGNPLLYDEFKQHFVQMGEKSFDHTKKFWFNKLRKQYGLLEEEETAAKDEAVSAEIIKEAVSKPAPADATAAASSKPAGFKPRFRAGATKTPATESAKEVLDTPKAAEPAQPASETPAASPAPAVSSKPAGFKPRFKAGVTKATDAPTPDAKNPNPEANSTKAPTTESAKAADIPQAPQPDKPSSEAPVSPAPAASSKPAGFKPRFKAGVTKSPPKADE